MQKLTYQDLMKVLHLRLSFAKSISIDCACVYWCMFKQIQITHISRSFCTSYLWCVVVNGKYILQKKKKIRVSLLLFQNYSLFYLVTYSTSIDTVQDFYTRYKTSEELDDKVIVMDNHRSHWSEQIQDFLENIEAKPEYLPPCSSYFNPIETIWSWVKAKWRNSLLQLPDLD